MGSTLNTALVIGAIGIVAWIAIGMPTTIADLKQDIQNIKDQIAAPGSTPATASSTDPNATQQADAQQPAADTSAPSPPPASAPTAAQDNTPVDNTPPLSADQQQNPSPPQFHDLSDFTPQQQPDLGVNTGTAAPSPPIAPVVTSAPAPATLVTPPPPVGPSVQQQMAAAPGHHFQHTRHGVPLAPGQGAKLAQKHQVRHHPPHAVKVTLPKLVGKGKTQGTPGWYTAKGHHHCIAGTAGCICTDKNKCHVTTVVTHHNSKKKPVHHSNYAAEGQGYEYTGNFQYPQESYVSDMFGQY